MKFSLKYPFKAVCILERYLFEVRLTLKTAKNIYITGFLLDGRDNGLMAIEFQNNGVKYLQLVFVDVLADFTSIKLQNRTRLHEFFIPQQNVHSFIIR